MCQKCAIAASLMSKTLYVSEKCHCSVFAASLMSKVSCVSKMCQRMQRDERRITAVSLVTGIIDVVSSSVNR